MRGGVLVKLAMCLLFVAACNLDGGEKRSCNVQTDCLTGFVCTNQTCVAHPDGGDDITLPDAPSNGREYGTVMALAPASSGLVAENYKALVGTTAAGGNLGCTVIRDEAASPGTATALAYAKIPRGESGDTRCPDGNHAIVNDPASCLNVFNELYDNCAVYKQWDASGKQIANRLAIGGYVAIQDTRISDMQHTCNIELSAAFPGGVTITKTFSYAYNPFAPESAFCTH